MATHFFFSSQQKPNQRWTHNRDYITAVSEPQRSQCLIFMFNQGRIKLFGAPRQWKHFRPLFEALFLSGGGYITPQTVKHQASQSQDRNNKYFILYIEFCINNKI